MLKWSGDFTLPRLRARLANKYLLHPDVEPDYEEVYRTDLSQTSIVRKDASDAHQAWPDGSSPSWRQSLGQNGSWASTGSRTPAGSLASPAGAGRSGRKPSLVGGRNGSLTGSLAGSQSGSSLRQGTWRKEEGHGLRKNSSMPSLGIRRVDRMPALVHPSPPGMQLGPAPGRQLPAQGQQWQLSSQSLTSAVDSTTLPGSPTAAGGDDKKEAEKEKQVIAASRDLWTQAIGGVFHITEQILLLEHAGEQDFFKALAAHPALEDPQKFLMKRALKAGAKVDWRNPEWDGATLLLKAVRTNCQPLALYLISQGADPSLTDYAGRGVLHWAAAGGHAEMMLFFLTNFRDLPTDIPDAAHDTPLHLAAFNGHLTVVRLLVALGKANVQLQNGGGFTPIQLATARRMWHVERYLSNPRQQEEDVTRAGNGTLEVRELVRRARPPSPPVVRSFGGLVLSCDLERANEVGEEVERGEREKLHKPYLRYSFEGGAF